jgi:phosphate transport system substrate-binding protein
MPDSELHSAQIGTRRPDGTFGDFTRAVVGAQSRSRTDYTKSEDDEVLVDGVASTCRLLVTSGMSALVR